MPRPASFLAASSQSATTRIRRRSADDRVLSVQPTTRKEAVQTALASGTTHDQPIVIHSDDDSDQHDRGQVTPCRREARHSEPQPPPGADTVLSVRSKSEVQLLPAPPTPLDTWPSMPRMSQTDPEVDRLSKRFEPVDSPVISPNKLPSPCGSKSYTYRGSYNNHLKICSKCQSIIARNIQSVEAATLTQSEASSERSVEKRTSRSRISGTFQEEERETVDPLSPTPKAAQSNMISRRGEVVLQQSAMDLHSRLLRKACASHTRKPREASVYLLRSPDLPGLVKVGMTGLITNRKSNFKSQCGQVTETIDIVDLMYGAERIEELVKLDLSEVNERWKCKNCGRRHQEWFRIDEDRAKNILQMWVDWLEQKPYQTDGHIKPIWRHLLWQSLVPVPRFKNEDHEARHAHWEKALRVPTPDELDKFASMHPPVQQQQEPASHNRERVIASDAPSRLDVSATPIRNTTYNITDNSVNRYRHCESISREILSDRVRSAA